MYVFCVQVWSKTTYWLKQKKLIVQVVLDDCLKKIKMCFTFINVVCVIFVSLDTLCPSQYFV